MITLIDEKQPSLIKYSVFKKYDIDMTKIIITSQNIVHTQRLKCPYCGTKCNYNGSSNKGHNIFSRTYNCYFRKGQQFCPNCKKTIQVENAYLDEVLAQLSDYISSQVTSLSLNMSEEEIKQHLERVNIVKTSKTNIHNIISSFNENLEELSLDSEINPEKYYGYDEQYIKINGKRGFRIAFLDIETNELIYEKTLFSFNKRILASILKEVFKDKKPKGFVTDMRIWYPEVFKSVFGKDIKIQFCIFHLNKSLLKKYKDALKVGRIIKWTLYDKKMLYLLFDIFYDRSKELKKLETLIECFKRVEDTLNEKNLKQYAQEYDVFPNKELVLRKVEKSLIREFDKFCREQKLSRKRNKSTLTPRSKEDAQKKLKETLCRLSAYPKDLWKSIKTIQKNFELFTASEGKITTNNKLEGFFGATLKKFRKKQKRSMKSFSAMLKVKRAIKKGKLLFKKFSLFQISRIFVLISWVT